MILGLALTIGYLMGAGVTYELLKGGEFDVEKGLNDDVWDEAPMGFIACMFWPFVWSVFIPIHLGARVARRVKSLVPGVPKAYLVKDNKGKEEH